MDFDARFEICAPEVVAEDFDGEIVILNLEDGLYFSLAGLGNAIWTWLMAGQTPSSIVEFLARHNPDSLEETGAFIHRLGSYVGNWVMTV